MADSTEYVVLQNAVTLRVGKAKDAVQRFGQHDRISLNDTERTKRLVAAKVIARSDKKGNAPVTLTEALRANGTADDPVKAPIVGTTPVDEAPSASPVA